MPRYDCGRRHPRIDPLGEELRPARDAAAAAPTDASAAAPRPASRATPGPLIGAAPVPRPAAAFACGRGALPPDIFQQLLGVNHRVGGPAPSAPPPPRHIEVDGEQHTP